MVIIVNTPQDFDGIFEGLDGLVIALFFASKDPETGVAWCPDCVNADPFIQVAANNHPNTNFLFCEVGQRDEWKNQEHPYRLMQNTKVKCVPTLIRYQNKQETSRLEEEQLLNQEILNEFFN